MGELLSSIIELAILIGIGYGIYKYFYNKFHHIEYRIKVIDPVNHTVKYVVNFDGISGRYEYMNIDNGHQHFARLEDVENAANLIGDVATVQMKKGIGSWKDVML